jgi:hypothetical protein
MRYEFKDREEMIGMYNSIPTPHSHGIVIDGNNLIVEWDGDAPQGWDKYHYREIVEETKVEVKTEEKVKTKKSKKK